MKNLFLTKKKRHVSAVKWRKFKVPVLWKARGRKMWLSSLKVERRTCCDSTAQDDANVVCQTGADKWHFAWFLRFLSLSLNRCVCVTGFVQHSSSLLISSCRMVNLNNPRRLFTTCPNLLLGAPDRWRFRAVSGFSSWGVQGSPVSACTVIFQPH